MNKLNTQKILYSLVCIMSVIIPYLLLGPMEIYVGNILAFKFSWLDFFIPSLFIAITVSCLLALILSFINDNVFYFIHKCFTVIAFLSYIQVMFMNIKLMEDDGNHMDFSSIGKFYHINLVIWIVVIVTFFYASIKVNKELFHKACLYLCAFLCLVQLAGLVSLLITTDTDPNKRSYQFSGENQFALSDDENILVLVLDAYSNRFFDYACENDSTFSAPLQDFTYYTNADSVYIPTFPSLAHMLTGGEFYFADSTDVWFKDVWHTDKANSFYDTVHDKGYSFNLYTCDTHNVIGLYEDVEGKLDNAVRTEVSVYKPGLLKLLYKMSAYRYVPYVMKPYLEVLTPEFAKLLTYAHKEVLFDNYEYADGLKSGGFYVDATYGNNISITHIEGLHNITSIDESMPVQNEVMDIIKDYLNSIKATGKYDDTTIIITADHGKYDFAEYQPIFFVKKKNETHSTLERNTAPISHDDFMATILSLIDADSSSYGVSIFDISEDEKRTRTISFVSESNREITSYEYTGDIDALIDEMNRVQYGE